MSQQPLTTARPDLDEPVLALGTDAGDAVIVVRACGELDGDTAPTLTAHVDRVVADHSPLLLVLDLAGVDFMGAAGITALLYVRDTLSSSGGQLLLHEPSAQVSMVLRLGGATGLFDVKGDR
jgi:anti-sigma B factor antagonist